MKRIKEKMMKIRRCEEEDDKKDEEEYMGGSFKLFQ